MEGQWTDYFNSREVSYAMFQVAGHLLVRDLYSPNGIKHFAKMGAIHPSSWVSRFLKILVKEFGDDVVVNDWFNGGLEQHRGVLGPDHVDRNNCEARRFGFGIEFKLKKGTDQDLYEFIENNNNILIKSRAYYFDKVDEGYWMVKHINKNMRRVSTPKTRQSSRSIVGSQYSRPMI